MKLSFLDAALPDPVIGDGSVVLPIIIIAVIVIAVLVIRYEIKKKNKAGK